MTESFEDDMNVYVVTHFMPAGDMYNYLVKQPSQPLPECQGRKIIL